MKPFGVVTIGLADGGEEGSVINEMKIDGIVIDGKKNLKWYRGTLWFKL